MPILLLLNLHSEQVCKAYPFFFALKLATSFLVPNDYGNHKHDIFFLYILMNFAMTAFDFWKSSLAFMLPVGATQAVLVIHYEYNPAVIMIVLRGVGLCLCYLGLFLMLVTFIYSLGNLIVKNFVLRKGNEDLLDNLQEGVIIANSKNGKLMFANAAA